MAVLSPIQSMNLKLSAGAVAASLVLVSPGFALSMAVGSLIEALNFDGLRRSAGFMFAGEISGGRNWVRVFALRFSLLALVIFAAMHFGADPIGLVIGLSLMLPAVVIEVWRARPSVDANAPALDSDDPIWDLWDPWLARERRPHDAEDES
jgi:hypothetical protein